jgi:NACHT domain
MVILDTIPRSVRDLGEEAELRYQELLLRAVNAVDIADIVDPATLSDAPGSLVAPELRRLYVPLRVKTVMAAEIPDIAGTAGTADAATAGRRGERAEIESRRVPVGERLAAVPRLVVLGEPGAGKSTLVRWLATAYLLRQRSIRDWIGLPDIATLPFDPLLPVVVSCRDLDAEAAAGSLDDLLRHTLRRTGLGEEEVEALLARLHDRLGQGRLLLLFDGLDAVGDLAARASLARRIEQTALAFPETFIVVTSRPAGYRELGCRLSRSFEHVTITELSREDKEELARLWYRLHELRSERRRHQAEELIRAIHGSPRIERLAGNPMLLTLMALVMPDLMPGVGRLPQCRADLYGQAVNRLLRPGASPEALHPTFQDYLAARALVDGCFPGRDPQLTLAETVGRLAGQTVVRPDGGITVSERWREVLRLCVECAGEAAGEVLLALLHPLPGEDEATTARPRAVLAAQCLADDSTADLTEEPRIGEATAQEVLDGLARQVRDREGSPLWRTSLDHAVRDLAESRWLPWLRLALVREFRARPAAERWSLGFLFMKLTAISGLAGGETAPPASPPFADREEEDTAFALEAVGSAFAAAEIDARALSERLLPLLAGSPATAHAAAWALYSLLGRSREASPWLPTAAEVERLACLAARPDLDTAAAWCLGKILARSRVK